MYMLLYSLRVFFFFFKQKTAYEMLRSLVGSEMCIRDSINAEYGGGMEQHEESKRKVNPPGAFVYQGSGKKQPVGAPIEQKLCIDEARAVQWCLARNGYNQKYCKTFIEAMGQCHRNAKTHSKYHDQAKEDAELAAKKISER
eukprot:TRINITY_DN13897_c0_g1_i1.p1 TRINITY_DN13897_c0_g1~~TRINITY_DN13897_c0_g1_i1.p1  ORF type:complete len:142 (-),score=46.49 TRINITY_DN13897_c0_g1_i1:401-826(-)